MQHKIKVSFSIKAFGSKVKTPLLLFGLFAYFLSCTSVNETDLVKDAPLDCDTVNMSYTLNIEPILSTSCVDCHNSFSASGNIILDNYSDVKTIAESGRLLGAIKHEAGYVPMPLDQDSLPSCDIKLIEAWINQGIIE